MTLAAVCDVRAEAAVALAEPFGATVFVDPASLARAGVSTR